MTFKEIYTAQKEKEKALTPGAVFVKEIAALTYKSEVTVRTWLVDGPSQRNPDALTQKILAEHFGTTPEELFPTPKTLEKDGPQES